MSVLLSDAGVAHAASKNANEAEVAGRIIAENIDI
jgi:hypothetical protein